MPARPRPGRAINRPPTDTSCSRSYQQLASAGGRLIARRASGGIGGPGDHPAQTSDLRFASVTPCLRVEARSVTSVPSVREYNKWGVMRRPSPFVPSFLIALAVSSLTAAQSAPERQQTAETATPAPAKLTGLPYFGTVSTQLYRGAQPVDSGFAELKKLGIGIVVNLRHEPDEIARERGLVEQQGMQYVSIPWRGKQDPKTEQVAQFLELLRASPGKKVFVHCERGAERTGVMVACYRISSERWTAEQALNEMEAFRFRGLLFGHLKKFVRAFPGLLLNDPFLKTLAQPSSLP